MIKLAIFDLDGTLVNSIYDLADATNKALSEAGFPVHETKEYYRFVGNGARKLCERVLPPEHRTDRQIDALQLAFSKYYEQLCFNKTKPYPGISKLLSDLHREGIRSAVASNKPDSFSCRIVSHFFGDSFDLVVGKRDGIPTKPDPAVIRLIMSELEAAESETVMIGDSNVDVLTAKNSGILSIGCDWGFRGEDELRAAGCTSIAYEPQDILRLIRRME